MVHLHLPAALFVYVQLFRNGFGSKYEYYESGDFKGKIKKATGALGYYSTYSYFSSPSNLKGELKKITYYHNGTEIGHDSYTYDSKRNLTSATDQNGVTAHYSYDASGNVISTTAADSATLADADAKITTQTAYDQTGSFAVSSTDARGNTTSTVYDGNNSNITLGNITSTTDARGNTIGYTYDQNTNALTSVTGTADVNGSAAQVTNTYTYNDYRLSGITVASGTTSAFTYSFEYDAFGRTSSVSAADRTLISHEYEEDSGNLAQSTYGNGDKKKPKYELDRIAEMCYKDSNESDFSTLYTWQYGANGSVGRTTNLMTSTKRTTFSAGSA